MTTTKFNSTMQNIYDKYKMSYNYKLYDCYGSISSAKAKAFEYCENLCKEHNGKGLKIIGFNKTQFSMGFEYRDNENKLHFVYITKDYDRDCIIPNTKEEE